VNDVSLRGAHASLLDAAERVTEAPVSRSLDPGEWTADQVLGHVALLQAAMLSAASAVAAGVNSTFDTRISHNPWTIDHVAVLTGGRRETIDRIRRLGEVLAALVDGVLSESELDTPVSSLLISSDRLFVRGPLTLRSLLAGFAENELPTHTNQLLALIPSPAD
jgi:hypothetical protein